MATRDSTPLFDPLGAVFDQWAVGALATNVLWTRCLGTAAVAAAQRQRLAELIGHARRRSPLYRRLWRQLPDAPLELADLPVTSKAQLMASFDDGCTDRAITWRNVETFIGARSHIGERFLGRYLVWTSSGTTGRPGVFIQDAAAVSVYDALVSVQLMRSAHEHRDWTLAAAQGGRAALVTADNDHFASIVSWRRAAQRKPWLDMQSFAVTLPLPELVAGLNAYAPAFVSSYPTVLALLAEEQNAGRLRLRPAGLWAGGEVLSPATRATVESAFRCPLANEYGASECLTIGYGCAEGALHVNAEWVILEPVERDFQPTPVGELSHTVLLTNLANRVQPIIRYDLGDSVRVRAGRCGCGNPLPAIEVEGRCDDVVTLRTRNGETARLAPLALTTVVEEAAHICRFQIVQSAPDRLLLRLPRHERKRAGRAAIDGLRRYLDRQGLALVDVRLDGHEPVADTRDGKLRQVVALRGKTQFSGCAAT